MVPGTSGYDILCSRRGRFLEHLGMISLRKGRFLEHLGMNCSILMSLEHLIFSIQGEVGPWNILVLFPLYPRRGRFLEHRGMISSIQGRAVPGTSWYDFLYPRRGPGRSWNILVWIALSWCPWNISVCFPLSKRRAVPGTSWYNFLFPRGGRFLELIGMVCLIQGVGGSWNILVWIALSCCPSFLYPRRGRFLEHLGMISSIQWEGGSWNILVWFPLPRGECRVWSLEHLGMILFKESAVPGTSWYDFLYPRRGPGRSWNTLVWIALSWCPWNISVWFPLSKGRAVPGTSWYDFLYPREGGSRNIVVWFALSKERAVPGTSWYMNCFVPEEGGPWNLLVWIALSQEREVSGTSWYELLYPRRGSYYNYSSIPILFYGTITPLKLLLRHSISLRMQRAPSEVDGGRMRGEGLINMGYKLAS
jgi:hypothetical protein